MARTRGSALGWRVSVDFCGARVIERGFAEAVTVGEGPAADLVLPGIGGAAGVVALAAGDRLLWVEGLEGVVERGGRREVLPVEDAALRLDEGDAAHLRLKDHPAVEVRIRRERGEEVARGVRPSLRDLAQHLALGAIVAGTVAGWVHVDQAIATVEVKGAPGATESRLARVLFASLAELPSAPALSHAPVRWAPAPTAAPPEAEGPAEVLVEDGLAGRIDSADDSPPRLVRGLTVEAASANPRPRQPRRSRAPARVAVEPAPAGPSASHAASGGTEAPGVASGAAAVAGKVMCSDPEMRPKEQVDVVFVVDVSTTMGFLLDRVEKGMREVDAAVREVSSEPRYGLVVFVDDVLVANGGRPYASVAELQGELRRWRSFTSSNRQILSEDANLDWPENSLDALHAAATEFAWRPAATTLRLVVHATDDDFGEAPAVQSGQRVRQTYRGTLDALRAAEVRVATFAAALGGQCECLDVKPGLRAGYGAMPSIPDATGGAAFDIDEVAVGRLSFAAAVKATVGGAICRSYPLWPLGGR